MFKDKEKIKVKVQQARIEDIPAIIEVEKAAWGEEKAATPELFESRIKTFPEGTLVALVDNKIVGVVATEIVNYPEEKCLTWYEITDNGYIKKTHNPKGDTLYGVDLSVHPLYQNKGVGKKLMIEVGKLAIKFNLKRGLLGGRVPYYHKYADRIKIEDYVSLKEKNEAGISPDPEIIFYLKLGLKILKIIPNYFQDPESLNYGILLVWENPFYNKWYRHIMEKIFRV